MIEKFLKLAALCCVFLTPSVQAGTVLDYAQTALLLELPKPVQSNFHDWPSVHAEAALILSQWQQEPPTLAWTRVQLQRYVKHKMMPTRGARGLALTHVAMADALELAHGQGLDAGQSRLALAMAAAQVLGYLFVAEERAFDRLVFALAAQQSGRPVDRLPPEVMAALSLGHAVGRAVLVRAEADGAQRGWNGLRLQYYGEDRLYGPGRWVPTPPYFYYPPDEPFAPLWKPWLLSSAAEFRPTPPAFGSAPYLQDVSEVLTVTRELNAEQLAIARFWVDGHGSVTPPGHWNQIAITEVLAAKLDARATARLFAQLNIALADTFIAVWDCKYHFWTARPITVAKPLFGLALKPALLTPPFPSYVSGHAAFSGAAARVLGQALPERAASLQAQAEQAAESRLLGGIHFRHDNEDGLKLGRQVADKVMQAPLWH